MLCRAVYCLPHSYWFLCTHIPVHIGYDLIHSYDMTVLSEITELMLVAHSQLASCNESKSLLYEEPFPKPRKYGVRFLFSSSSYIWSTSHSCVIQCIPPQAVESEYFEESQVVSSLYHAGAAAAAVGAVGGAGGAGGASDSLWCCGVAPGSPVLGPCRPLSGSIKVLEKFCSGCMRRGVGLLTTAWVVRGPMWGAAGVDACGMADLVAAVGGIPVVRV